MKDSVDKDVPKGWDERLNQLSDYRSQFGDCDVPGKWPEDQSFANWVSNVRNRRSRSQLSESKIASLENLGFIWSKREDLDEIFAARLKELADYTARFGDCCVPGNWDENPSLGHWVNNIRSLRKQGRLAEARIATLDAMGFVWGLRNRTVRKLDWDDMFTKYVALQAAQETSRPSLKGWPTLSSWAARLRRAKSEGKLLDEQIRELDAIGFDWTTPKELWESMFAALADYELTHGDCNVPTNWSENPKLANWVNRQRKKLRDATIKPESRQRLGTIGFEWQQNATDNWEEMFATLVGFKRQHGHCKVSRQYADDMGLARWVNSQRMARRSGTLDVIKGRRLDAIGFVWNVITETWEKMFEELKQYKTTYGHCDVPKNRPEYKRLASWINQQHVTWQALKESQRQPREHTLSRMKRLEEIGIDFGEAASHEVRWEENFAALQQYKARHGDCNVPLRSKDQPNLAAWVGYQRIRMKDGKLTEQQIARLTELGFIWSLHEFKWLRMYDELVSYKKRIGHCWVPSDWPENPRLASWVQSHRNERVTGKLSEERFKLLDELGFIWSKGDSSSDDIEVVGSLHDQKWKEMYDELVEYKQQFGNCDIPTNWPRNPRLASWVSSQRSAKKSEKLAGYRIQLLDRLGFIWKKKQGRPSLESNGDS